MERKIKGRVRKTKESGERKDRIKMERERERER